MNSTLDEITDEALKLTPVEREMLIERLILAGDDLPPMSLEVQDEALRRLHELTSGRSKPVPHEEVMERLRKKFPECA